MPQITNAALRTARGHLQDARRNAEQLGWTPTQVRLDAYSGESRLGLRRDNVRVVLILGKHGAITHAYRYVHLAPLLPVTETSNTNPIVSSDMLTFRTKGKRAMVDAWLA